MNENINVKHSNPFMSAFSGTIGKGCGCVALVIILFVVIGILGAIGSKKQTNTNIENTTITETTTLPPAITPTPAEPLKLTGVGKKATNLFTLEKGLRRFTMNYRGTSNFIVKLLDENGNAAGGSFGFDSLIANEIGNFEGSKAVKMEKTGNYLLDITGEGSWTIVIE